jgi:hypothetical protein
VKFNTALCEPPFKAATIVADPLAVTAATVAVKVAVFWPVAKDTNPGTVTFELLLESKTLAPAPGQAGTVTVQVDVPGAFTVAGEQVNEVTCVA